MAFAREGARGGFGSHGAAGGHLTTTTPNPATTSNGWMDGGSSLKAMESVRLSLNAWKKTLPLGITSCIDIAAQVEDPGRPGYWLGSASPYTPDGLHDNLTAQPPRAMRSI